MASTFSPSLRIELIGDGDQSGIWGQTTNNNLGGLIEQAIAGVVTINMLDTNYTMTNFNGVADEARNQVLVLTGTNTAQRNLIAPLVEKTYTVKNTTDGGFAVQIIGSSGIGVVVPNGVTTTVYCDGLNFYTSISGVVGNFSVTGTTALTGALTASTATFSGAISSVSPSFTGTPVAPTAAPGTNTTQIATTAFATAAALAAFPVGGIIMWSGSIASIPSGWLLCNGSSGTPDLRDRFIVGAGSTYAVNATGGFATYSLSGAQLPSHTHSLSASGTTSGQSANHSHTFSGTTGGMNQNTIHNHSVSDGGHSHQTIISIAGSNPQFRTAGTGGDIIGATAEAGTTNVVTGISINAVNLDHLHGFSGGTSAASVDHNHTVTVTGTSGATGSGASIDNRPPYFALAYIMKA
jgi:microcystin-dependent protein